MTRQQLDRLIDALNDFTLEDLLEHCDLSAESALEILWFNGALEVPPFLEDEEEDGLE